MNWVNKTFDLFKAVAEIHLKEVKIRDIKSKTARLVTLPDTQLPYSYNTRSSAAKPSSDSIRKNYGLMHHYYVNSDLIRCAIEFIVNEISRRKYQIVDISGGKIKYPKKVMNAVESFFEKQNMSKINAESGGYFGLFGNGAIWIRRNQFGDILKLEPISWKNLTPTFKTDEYAFDYFSYNINNKMVQIPYNDIIHILPPMKDPADSLYGVPRMCACMDALRCQEELYQYIYNLLKNGNNDGLFVNFKNDEGIDDGILQEVINRVKLIFEDPTQVGKAIVTENAEIHASAKSRQTPFDNLPEITAKQVSRCFGVPEKYLNQSNAGQYGSNTAVDERNRADECILSYELPICWAITEKILHQECGLYGLAFMPVKLASPLTLEGMRALSVAYRDGILKHLEYRSAINHEILSGDRFNELFAGEITNLLAKENPMNLQNSVQSNNETTPSDGEQQRQARDS